MKSALKISILLAVVMTAMYANAVMYKYTDESGSTSYTDSLQNVPAHLRSSAVRMDDSNLPKVKREASKDISEMERKTEEYKKAAKIESLKRNPYLFWFGVAVILIVAFMLWKIGKKKAKRSRSKRRI